MEKVAYRGDWFDAGLGLEALARERFPSGGARGEHALALDPDGLRSARALWVWVERRLRELWSRRQA